MRLGEGDLVFVTRSGCPLCDEGLALVRKALRRSESVAVVDVDASRAHSVYGPRVPVLIDRRGVVLAEGKMTPAEVRAALEAARRA